MHKVILMSKAHKVITSINSILSEYTKCENIRLCQWIDEHIINDTYNKNVQNNMYSIMDQDIVKKYYNNEMFLLM